MTELTARESSRTIKRQQILNGARKEFLRSGFDGVSVDAIADVAKVSKATLYRHFGNKEKLFEAVVTNELKKQMEHKFDLDNSLSTEEALRHEARSLITFLLSPFAIKIFRLCVAEAEAFPAVARTFYQSGPEIGRRRLVAFLEAAVKKGELNIEDTALAADQFSELAKARFFLPRLLGLIPEPSSEEVNEVATEAVSTFLARYGANTQQ